MSGRNTGRNQGRGGRGGGGNRGGGRGGGGRRGGGGGRSKPKPLSEDELRQRREGEKAARMWESQGLYVWAEHWRKWAVSPVGTPQPPNYHTRPTFEDPRTKMYAGMTGGFKGPHRNIETKDGTLESNMGYDNYIRWRDKDQRKADRAARPYSENDYFVEYLKDENGNIVKGEDKQPIVTKKTKCLDVFTVQKTDRREDEKTMKELGEITNEKGHPYLLVRKAKEMRKKYPEFYKVSSGM